MPAKTPGADLRGTRQRLTGPSHGYQWRLAVLRMLVAPLSGSILSFSSKSTSRPFARSWSARLAAASNSAFFEDGIPHQGSLRSVIAGAIAATGARDFITE